MWQIKWIGRVFITVLLAAPFALLLFLISPSDIPNPYLFTFLCRIIPYTVMPFLGFAYSDFCSRKAGLLDEAIEAEHLLYGEDDNSYV